MKNPDVVSLPSRLVSSAGVLREGGTITQRAFAALQIEKIEAVEAKRRQGVRTDILVNLPESSPRGNARDKAAAAFAVSPSYVQAAKLITETAPELAIECLQGTLNIHEAMHRLKPKMEPLPPINPASSATSVPIAGSERPVYEVVVTPDEFTAKASDAFDYKFQGKSTFTGWAVPDLADFSEFKIGLILGPSGSGKSLLLRNFGEEEKLSWTPTKAVVSHFASPDEALNKLMAVGLNSTPAWCRPFHVLSTGEQFRAALARKIKPGAVIDEFTSVVDRNVAKSASKALRSYVDRCGVSGMVLATCHFDILNWLRPDWYFDTSDGTLHDGRSLQRPPIQLRIYSCQRTAWGMFKDHHYLTNKLPASTRTFLATADFGEGETIVGFVASMAMGFQLKDAWREARAVVLPDFQGLGIGPRLSDAVAQIHKNQGFRYFSKTAHPRFGQYRQQHSDLWKPTSKNLVIRTADKNAKQKRLATGKTATGAEASEFQSDMHNQGLARFEKLCFSHEYIGVKNE